MVRESLNPKLYISGMVLTMFDSRTNLAEQPLETLEPSAEGIIRLSVPAHQVLSLKLA